MKGNLAKLVKPVDDAITLAEIIAEGCTEAKAMDMKALDVTAISDVANVLLIVTGRSDRQTQGIAARAIAAAANNGVKALAIEGYDRGHWILVDFGDVVLHVFYGPMREHYGFDSLWRNATEISLGKHRPAPVKRKAPAKRRPARATVAAVGK